MARGDAVRKRRVMAALTAVGSTQQECAAALALSTATVSRVIAGLQHNDAVEAWICARTGYARADLFSEIAPTAASAA